MSETARLYIFPTPPPEAQTDAERIEFIQARQVDMLERIAKLEWASWEYVHPHLAQGDDRRAKLCDAIHRKLNELRHALSEADDVEVPALAASTRIDLKGLRDLLGADSLRRYLVSFAHDAIAFTPRSRLNAQHVSILLDLIAACRGTVSTDLLTQFRKRLRDAGMELFPVANV